jgi:uncharacterized protein YdhG (YjbR/CyaY superfamily)
MTLDDLSALKKEQEKVMTEARRKYIAAELPDFVVKNDHSFTSPDDRIVVMVYADKIRVCVYDDARNAFLWAVEEYLGNVQKTVRFLQSFCK